MFKKGDYIVCEFYLSKPVISLIKMLTQAISLVVLWSESHSVMSHTVPGILQARILEWVAFPFSRGSSQPRDWTPRILEWVAYPFFSGSSWPRNRTTVSCIAGRFFTNWAIKEAHVREINLYGMSFLLIRHMLSFQGCWLPQYGLLRELCFLGWSRPI